MNDQITYPDELTLNGCAEFNEDRTNGLFFASPDAMNQNTDNREAILSIADGTKYSITTGSSTYPASMKDSRTRLEFSITDELPPTDDTDEYDAPPAFFIG
jgi:hypothetical protein